MMPEFVGKVTRVILTYLIDFSQIHPQRLEKQFSFLLKTKKLLLF